MRSNRLPERCDEFGCCREPFGGHRRSVRVGDVRDIEHGRHDRSGELRHVMDDEVWLPAFGDRQEIVEHRRGGDRAEQSGEHVRRQIFRCQRRRLGIPLEVRRPPFGGTGAARLAGDARLLDDVDGVGSRCPSHLVAHLRQALCQGHHGQHVPHRRRRRHEDPHRRATLGDSSSLAHCRLSHRNGWLNRHRPRCRSRLCRLSHRSGDRWLSGHGPCRRRVCVDSATGTVAQQTQTPPAWCLCRLSHANRWLKRQCARRGGAAGGGGGDARRRRFRGRRA